MEKIKIYQSKGKVCLSNQKKSHIYCLCPGETYDDFTHHLLKCKNICMFDAWERDVGENNYDDDDDDDDDDDNRMMCIREWCVAPGVRRHLTSQSPSI